MTPPQHPNAPGGSGGFGDPAAWDGPGSAPSGISTSAGFYNWSLSTGDVICDEQTFRLHGLPPDADPRFETFLAQVPPQDVEDLLLKLQPLVASVGDYMFEYRVRW